VALDPRRRLQRRHRAGNGDVPKTSRVPWIIGAIGFVAMLALVYQMSVSGISSTTQQMFSWQQQSPP
jgi:hypothetical protein